MKRYFNKLKVDATKYRNDKSGKTLDEEHPNITSLNRYNKNMIKAHYDNYVIVNSKAFDYINSVFTDVEISRILKMANMVQGCFNILHIDDDNHHTEESLMATIKYSRNKYNDFMKKLELKNIINYQYDYKDRKPVVYILLNPYLARKTKAIHKDCYKYFDDLKLKESKANETN